MNLLVSAAEPSWVQEGLSGLGPTLAIETLPWTVQIAAPDGALLVMHRLDLRELGERVASGGWAVFLQPMLAQTRWVYLLLEQPIVGDREDNLLYWRDGEWERTGWKTRSLWGALLTAQDLGVGVMSYAGRHQLVTTVLWLAHRERGDIRVSARRVATLWSPGEATLATLPGLGPKKGADVLAQTGSVGNALACLTSDTPLKGVGKKTKAKIRAYLGGRLIYERQGPDPGESERTDPEGVDA